MRRQQCPEGQIDIFPPELMAQLFAHPEPTAPLPPLPFERNKEVDVERACKILNTHPTTIQRMLKGTEPLLRGYKIGKWKGHPYRIEYASIIEHCDRLRMIYHFPERRTNNSGRTPDAQILPFAPDETVTMQEVATHLDVVKATVTKLIDTGDLAAYQLIPHTQSPWRIHRPSFVKYLEALSSKISRRGGHE